METSSSLVTLMSIVVVFFIAVGVIVTLWGIFRFLKLALSRLKRWPALVVDKRMRVRGGGQHTSASTHYYVTLQFKGGGRRELKARGRLFGEVTAGDVGVAYVRDRFLLAYRRLAH